jgi:8-oxo-dGTP pyrophosphatase MutT (NUDIX family)
VTREQALKMFTIWAAFAAFEEKSRGSIEVGKFADLTAVLAEIMKIPEMEILKTRCVMTVISDDGERWGWPEGRPEGDESWEQTLRREVLEEACATVVDARLLGFTRSLRKRC